MIKDPQNFRRLHHIADAAEHIAEFIKGVSKREFDSDLEKQSAVIRQFEIIGEAASKLTPEFLEQHQEIDWKKVIGMRHKMIHDYFDVDVDIVWNTACDDVVPLKHLIAKILKGN